MYVDFKILSTFCENCGDFEEVDKVNSQYGIENSFIGIIGITDDAMS